MSVDKKLPLTVLLAIRNEAVNLSRCLDALEPASRVIVLDSHSTDNSAEIATSKGAEVVQFDYTGGYPKKRQWALDNIDIDTTWILLIDADEVVPSELWLQISDAIERVDGPNAFFITKGFHFLGRRFRYGGFSHSAVLLFRNGKANFERVLDDVKAGLDMEVHERVIVEGEIGKISEPLIHEDFKGLEAYIDRHNRYSSWEARVRHQFLSTGRYGEETINPRFFGNSQERRRRLKSLIIRMPFEQHLWFFYHFIFRLGFLEGRRGLIACQIRASYIAQVRAKVYEFRIGSLSSNSD